MKQSLGRQAGVQSVEVSLLNGTAEVTPKADGAIDPAQLLKVTYDSGVTIAEMDMVARGTIVKDASGNLAFRVEPNRTYPITPNDLSKGLESLAGSNAFVTLRGQLYKKPPKKKKGDTSAPLKFLILEVQKKE